eukprot:1160618-Pelagomonas_calceolata.AAC.2
MDGERFWSSRRMGRPGRCRTSSIGRPESAFARLHPTGIKSSLQIERRLSALSDARGARGMARLRGRLKDRACKLPSCPRACMSFTFLSMCSSISFRVERGWRKEAGKKDAFVELAGPGFNIFRTLRFGHKAHRSLLNAAAGASAARLTPCKGCKQRVVVLV